MRTKRILSLMLAVMMLASLTITASAAAQSKVFLTEDFDYADTNDFLKTYGWLDADGNHTAMWNTSSRTAANKIEASGKLAELRAAGISHYYYHDHANNGSQVRGEMTTNSNGAKAWGMTYTTGRNSWGDWVTIIAPQGWNAIDNFGEAMVVDFDMEISASLLPDRVKYYLEKEDGTRSVLCADEATRDSILDGKTPSNSSWGYGAISWETAQVIKSLDSGAVSIKSVYGLSGKDNITYDTDKSQTFTATDGTVYYKGVATNVTSTTEQTIFGQDKANYSGGTATINVGQIYNYASKIFAPAADATKLQRQSYIDGVQFGNNAAHHGFDSDYTIEGFQFRGTDKVPTKYSNLRMYTLKTAEGSFNVSSTASAAPVSASTTSVEVKFSQPVAPASFDKSAVVVKKNGVAMDSSAYSVSDLTDVVGAIGEEIYSTVRVTFLEDLDIATDYTIEFPSTVTNTIATELGTYNTVAFRTVTPAIILRNFKIVTGFNGTEAVAENFKADGTLQGAALSIENTTAEDKNVAVIYAVYTTGGQLSDVVYANATITANTTGAVDAGLKLSSAGTVKAFVWDGISSLKPYANSTVKTILAE